MNLRELCRLPEEMQAIAAESIKEAIGLHEIYGIGYIFEKIERNLKNGVSEERVREWLVGQIEKSSSDSKRREILWAYCVFWMGHVLQSAGKK